VIELLRYELMIAIAMTGLPNPVIRSRPYGWRRATIAPGVEYCI
jgi:hypothetical protein